MARKTDQAILDKAVRMYEDGMTAPKIANQLGTSSTVVYRALHEAGIKPTQMMRRGERGHANRRFTDEQEQEIIRRYQEGGTGSQLAAEFGCNAFTIFNVMRRHGIQRRRQGSSVRGFTDEQVQTIADRWKAGESQANIAADFNAGQTTISRVLRFHGIDPSPRVATRERHGNWNGGRHVLPNGYVFVHVPADSPYAAMRTTQGYVQEHRLVMAEYLGRPLESWETVHHINSDRQDNQIKNLQLRIGNHGKHVQYVCADCGSHRLNPEVLA